MKTNKLRSKFTFLLFLVLLMSSSFAATYETTQNGNYNTKSTWNNNSRPGTTISSNNTVNIKHTINLDQNLTVYGTLVIESSASLIGSKNITLKSGGQIVVNSTLGVKDFTIYGTLSSTATINISDDLTIYSSGNFSSSGSTNINDELYNDGIFTNSGTCSVNDDVKNYKYFTNSGNLTISDYFYFYRNSMINSGTISIKKFYCYSSSSATNSGTITVTEDMYNYNSTTWINSGTITIGDDMNNYSSSTFTTSGVLTISDDLTIYNSATITNSGTLTINDELTIYGDIINNNYVSVSQEFSCQNSGSILNNNSFVIQASDNVSLNRGTITIGSNGTFTVKSMFENSNSGLIKNNGLFVLVNDANNYATFIDDGTMNGTGNAKVELFLKGAQWHYVAIPTTTASSNVFWGGAIYSFDEETDKWTKHINDENLDVTKGYDVYFKTDKTISFVGTLRIGDQTATIHKNGTGNNAGYNLIANPYPTTVDWKSNSWSKKKSNDGLYIWNPDNQNVSSYVSGVGTNSGSRYIPPMQAYFVKCSGSGGSIKSTKNVKTHNKSSKFRSETDVNDELLILKATSENGFYDESIIRFSNQSSLNFDGDYDADKMWSNNITVPQIYTKSADFQDLSINSIPEVSSEVSIPLYMKARISGKNTMELDLKNATSVCNVYLEDVKLKSIHNLLTGPYEFTSDVQDEEFRFIIHFTKQNAVSADTNKVTLDIQDTKLESCKVYSSSGAIVVEQANGLENESTIRIFNMVGKEIKKLKTKETYNRIELDAAAAYYTVQIKSGKQIYTNKVLVR